MSHIAPVCELFCLLHVAEVLNLYVFFIRMYMYIIRQNPTEEYFKAIKFWAFSRNSN